MNKHIAEQQVWTEFAHHFHTCGSGEHSWSSCRAHGRRDRRGIQRPSFTGCRPDPGPAFLRACRENGRSRHPPQQATFRKDTRSRLPALSTCKTGHTAMRRRDRNDRKKLHCPSKSCPMSGSYDLECTVDLICAQSCDYQTTNCIVCGELCVTLLNA